MKGYLGTTPVQQATVEQYAKFGPTEWALEFAGMYAGIDGGHHKAWVIDQMTRILLGTPVKIDLARWENGQSEYRASTGEPSEAYLKWVQDYQVEDPETGEPEYEWNIGIAP